MTIDDEIPAESEEKSRFDVWYFCRFSEKQEEEISS